MTSADTMADVFTFVLLTIQQPIKSIPDAMRDVRRKGSSSAFLWGMKANGWQYVQSHKSAIYHDLGELQHIPDPDWRDDALLEYLAIMPGFGMVKAGFVAQLLFGRVGCIDTHNIDRFGLEWTASGSQPTWLKSSAYKERRPAARQALRQTYLALTRNQGGAEALWNGWCAYVAEKYPNQYESASYVSKLHVDAILP